MSHLNIESIRLASNPDDLGNDHLRALWYDLHGNWDAAHRIVQQMSDVNAMWIHAYLHRKEPDINNAKYWYRSAAKAYPEGMTFDAEAAMILAAMD